MAGEVGVPAVGPGVLPGARTGALRLLARDRFSGWLLAGYLALGAVLVVLRPGAGPQVSLFWAAQAAVQDPLIGYLAWQNRRVATRAPVRRLWSATVVAASLYWAGDWAQTWTSRGHPGVGSFAPGGVESAFAGVGILLILLGMLAYPTSATSAGSRLRLGLDVATVMAGATGFTWCLTVAPTLGGSSRPSTAAVVTAVLLLTTAFATAKTMLSLQPPMARAPGLLLFASLLLVTFSVTLTPTPAVADLPWRSMLGWLPSVLMTLSFRLQLLRPAQAPVVTADDDARATISPLPYVAVVATFALHLALLPDDVGPDGLGAAVAVVVITGLVVARQLTAFHDNRGLIRELHESLRRAERLHDQLEHAATHDALTGLANRALFGRRLDDQLAGDGAASVVLVDLDDFKAVNDTHGHAAGDALLVEVAVRLATCFPGDTVARLGGDEFAVLLARPDGAEGAARAERFVAALGQPLRFDGATVQPGASVGLACGAAADGDDLLARADAAMYVAKSRGKGRLAVGDAR